MVEAGHAPLCIGTVQIDEHSACKGSAVEGEGMSGALVVILCELGLLLRASSLLRASVLL